ncbi:MAG TPA: hypothetical protein VGR03_12555 [Candidatus Acidoferrum sp.]|nr:hypothetical protein [Candidatus Acidoferrum sp.]
MIAGILAPVLNAQKGTAPNGYYPQNYSGSIFTGSLDSADANTQEITLVFSKGNKTERFVGQLEATCGWKDKGGTLHSFGADEIPKGSLLTAFYIPVTKKVDGHKTTQNAVFAISYLEFEGKKLPDEKRAIIFCSTQKSLRFMAF